MHGPERLMLDWIIGVAANKFTSGSESEMKDFGLTPNQIDVLLSEDARSIREWVAYELGQYSVSGGVTHWGVVPGTHGLPPPPPPPRGSGGSGQSAN
jgi:hypothetical protein